MYQSQTMASVGETDKLLRGSHGSSYSSLDSGHKTNGYRENIDNGEPVGRTLADIRESGFIQAVTIDTPEIRDDEGANGEANDGTASNQNNFLGPLFICIILLIVTLVFILGFCIIASSISDNPVIDPFTVDATIRVILCLAYFIAVALITGHRFAAYNCFHENVSVSGFLLFLVLFVFMPIAVIYRMIELTEAFYLRNCCNPIGMIAIIFEVIFIMVSSVYIRKHLKYTVSGSSNEENYTKVTIISVVLACLCQWINELISEKNTEFIHSVSTRPPICLNASVCLGDNYTQPFTDFKHLLKPLLSPFVIEFALSVVALLYLPFQKVGNREIYEVETHEVRTFLPLRMRSGSFLIGSSAVVLCIMSIIMFSSFHNPPYSNHGLELFQNLIVVVFIIGISANGALVYQIHTCESCPCESSADRIVLWSTMVGQLLMCLSISTASALEIQSGNSEFSIELLWLTFTIYAFGTIQVTFQTITLDRCLVRRLQPVPGLHSLIKKGQPSLILLMVNLGMWIVNIYLSHLQDTCAIAKLVFGENLWAVLQALAVPLCTMQRLHSAVLCYDVLLKLTE